MKKNNFSSKYIDDKNYISVGERAENEYSIFSTLNFLNRNTDLYKHTKNSVSTIIKLTSSASLIKELMEKTNVSSFDDLVSRVKKSFVKPDDSLIINNLAKDVKTFMILAKKQKLNIEKVVNYEKKATKSPLLNYENTTSNLVKNVTYVYGENRYFDAYEKPTIGQMLPLKTKFETKEEGVKKLSQVSRYVKSIYKLDVKSQGQNAGRNKKHTLYVPNYSNTMDNVVSVLYNVSKTLVGSKNLKLKEAQGLLNKNEPNVFLNSKTVKNSVRNHVFKAHKEEIIDVVNTLTTIFMARFVFDSKYFSKIERDLSEQACVKMKNLVVLNNEDYWINELIQDRVKLNCSQILASNNIKNVRQLADVYSSNGTKIVNPENVVTLDDMIFSLQYNENSKVETPELPNAKKGLSEEVEPTLKKEEKVKKVEDEKTHEEFKKAKHKKEADNSYLKAIRETDVYKKYLEKYEELLKLSLISNVKKSKVEEKPKDLLAEMLEKLNNIEENTEENVKHLENLTINGKLAGEIETSKKEVEEVKQKSENNLNDLNLIAQNDNLTSEITDRLTNATAKNDAVIEKCDELLNEEVETKEETNEQEKLVADILDKLNAVEENTEGNLKHLENLTKDGKLIGEIETSKKEVVEIKNDSNNNLTILNFVAQNDNLSSEITNRITDATAKNDAIIEKCDELLNEEVSTKDDGEKPNDKEETKDKEKTNENEKTKTEEEKPKEETKDKEEKPNNTEDNKTSKLKFINSNVAIIEPKKVDGKYHFVDENNNFYDQEFLQAFTGSEIPLHLVYYKDANGKITKDDSNILIDDDGFVVQANVIDDKNSEDYGNVELTYILDSVDNDLIVPVFDIDEKGRYIVDKFYSLNGNLVDRFGNVINNIEEDKKDEKVEEEPVKEPKKDKEVEIQKETQEEKRPVYTESNDGQLSFINGAKQTSQSEKETLQENIIDENQINIDEYLNEMKKQTFTTQRYVKTTFKNDEEKLKNQFKKYYSNVINGTKEKEGLVESALNYRIIEKKTTKKNNSSNDIERLDDKDFKKANAIRDTAIENIIEVLSNNAVKYVKDNYDKLDDKLTVERAGAKSYGDTIGYPEEQNFDRRKLKKFLSVMITSEANKELKDLNVELYTGKRTFKEVNEFFTKYLLKDENNEEK